MEYTKKIPEILHIYWGGSKPFSYMRYLSMKSFLLLNPDWEMRLHVPKRATKEASTFKFHRASHGTGYKDYIDQLKKLGVKVTKWGFGKSSDIPVDPGTEVHRSDLLRWKLLAEDGGFWADTDILFIRPMEQMQLSTPSANIVLCRYYNRRRQPVCPIGFMGSTKRNDFYEGIYHRAVELIEDGGHVANYQSIGRLLLDDAVTNSDVEIAWMPKQTVYPVMGGRDHVIYYRESDCDVDPATIGFHWYGGGEETAKHEARVTPDNITQYVGKSFLLSYMAEVIDLPEEEEPVELEELEEEAVDDGAEEEQLRGELEI